TWNVEKLKTEVKKQEEYRKEINKIIRAQREGEDIEEGWDNTKIAIEKAARSTTRQKGGKTKKEWYNEGCRKTIERKVEARIKLIGRKRQEHRENYEKMQRECNKIVQSSKKEWIQDKIKNMEKENNRKNAETFTRKEILNEEQTAEEIIIAEEEKKMEIEEPTLEEVREIVNRSRNVKFPGLHG
ncbi:hypothetical protein ILUMI_20090, partial [Ignelater luminosus]